MKKSNKVRAALLLGPGGTPNWLVEAIRIAHAKGVEIPLVLRCRNPLLSRRPLKHALYYVLNILAMRRGEEERSRRLEELEIGNPEVFEFDAEPSARFGWQRIPCSVADKVREHRCDLVIKAGMGLVENPDAAGARLGMLSYHHGDPSRYRGRPAGFWEIMEGAPTMGMMVQRINNRLDAGAVLAFGRSKVHAHSYRDTLANARRLSSALLIKAIRAAQAGETLPISTEGRNYRLPTNLQVCIFALKVAVAKLRRVGYGAFIQKAWHIGVVEAPPSLLEDVRLATPLPIATPPEYVFLADCFWAEDGAIYAEALRSRDGVGEIVRIANGCHSVVSDKSDGHCSYPVAYNLEGVEYILPESAGWAAPFLMQPGSPASGRIPLKGLEAERLVDPTLLFHGGTWYLFAGTAPHANEQLRLWVSSSAINGPYIEHPDSPIVINAESARMAGPFVSQKSRLLRLAQSFADGYGSSITVCEVLELTPWSYRERAITKLSLSVGKGPHSFAVRNGKALLDWYAESFDLLAGYRRFSALFKRRSRLGAKASA